MLKIYNSITRQKQAFVSINPNIVNIYVCGVTVYDYCHIGHARTYIFFDTVVRYLKYIGYKVNFVRNITDVDDKILNKAQQQGVAPQIITEFFIREMEQDFTALNLLPPNIEPKATNYINEMINLINHLVSNNYAYIGSNGDVFYNVSKFKNYGNLAKREFNNFQSTERVNLEIQAAKDNIQDFVLWKLVATEQMGWNSPWGYGRPGWHTECAAMSLKLFGDTFDIHGGGFDLMFPHHENEIAQVEAVNEKNLANYWMHVGFLQINQQKMSKSLGNFTTIREILNEVHPEVLRLFMLSSHYRSQIEFDGTKLLVAKNSLERLYIALRGVLKVTKPRESSKFEDYLQNYVIRFKKAIDDDFNTPLGLSILFELAKEINIFKEQSLNFDKTLEKYLFQDPLTFTKLNSEQIFNQELLLIKISLTAEVLISLGNAIGLLYTVPEEFFKQNSIYHQADLKYLNVEEIEDLIFKRNQARKTKDWVNADLIRKKLLDQGIILEDRGLDTIWRRVNT